MNSSFANGDMFCRALGATGEKVSAIGVGGWHLGLPKVGEPFSIRIVRTAVDRGITCMDNSWDYTNSAGSNQYKFGIWPTSPGRETTVNAKATGLS